MERDIDIQIEYDYLKNMYSNKNQLKRDLYAKKYEMVIDLVISSKGLFFEPQSRNESKMLYAYYPLFIDVIRNQRMTYKTIIELCTKFIELIREFNKKYICTCISTENVYYDSEKKRIALIDPEFVSGRDEYTNVISLMKVHSREKDHSFSPETRQCFVGSNVDHVIDTKYTSALKILLNESSDDVIFNQQYIQQLQMLQRHFSKMGYIDKQDTWGFGRFMIEILETYIDTRTYDYRPRDLIEIIRDHVVDDPDQRITIDELCEKIIKYSQNNQVQRKSQCAKKSKEKCKEMMCQWIDTPTKKYCRQYSGSVSEIKNKLPLCFSENNTNKNRLRCVYHLMKRQTENKKGN
jgi:hypothetical protein